MKQISIDDEIFSKKRNAIMVINSIDEPIIPIENMNALKKDILNQDNIAYYESLYSGHCFFKNEIVENCLEHNK